MPEQGRDLILAGAILSIVLNPFLFALLDRVLGRRDAAKAAAAATAAAAADGPREPVPVTALTGHIVLVGHGRVGSFIGEALRPSGAPLLVIDNEPDNVELARQRGFEAIARQRRRSGDVSPRPICPPRAAFWSRSPMPSRAGRWSIRPARPIHGLPIIARAHSEDEIEHLKKHGATEVVMSEHETAKAMIEGIPLHVLRRPVGQRQAAPRDFSLRSAVASFQ